MPSLQTQTALDTISELYGTPNWLSDPKKGMKIDSIFAQWDAALKGYTEEQVRIAIQKLWKYAKVSTTLRLGHILAELSDVAPEAEEGALRTVTQADDTEQQLVEQYVRNGFDGRLCFASDVHRAFTAMIDDMICALPREATAGKSYSELLRLARNNGFLEKFTDYLAKTTKNNPAYTPIDGVNRIVDLPSEFSPLNKKRKCA